MSRITTLLNGLTTILRRIRLRLHRLHYSTLHCRRAIVTNFTLTGQHVHQVNRRPVYPLRRPRARLIKTTQASLLGRTPLRHLLHTRQRTILNRFFHRRQTCHTQRTMNPMFQTVRARTFMVQVGRNFNTNGRSINNRYRRRAADPNTTNRTTRRRLPNTRRLFTSVISHLGVHPHFRTQRLNNLGRVRVRTIKGAPTPTLSRRRLDLTHLNPTRYNSRTLALFDTRYTIMRLRHRLTSVP